MPLLVLDGLGLTEMVLFIKNSVLRENPISSSDTESDSVTATMFNLDNLNADRPEAYQGAAWRRGHS